MKTFASWSLSIFGLNWSFLLSFCAQVWNSYLNCIWYFTAILIILGILVTRRSKNKENESPEGIKKSSTSHYSDTGIKIKINNENQTHIASVHDGKQPFQCNICDSYFSKKSKLASHVFSVHERNEQELPKNSSSTTRYTDSGIKIKMKLFGI